MAYWPRCSRRAPSSALERPSAHSVMFEDVVPLLWNDPGRWLDVLCLLWKCVCPSSSCIPPPLSGGHSWNACVFWPYQLLSFWLQASLLARRRKIGSLCFWLHSTICFPPPVFVFFLSERASVMNAVIFCLLINHFISSGSKHSDRDKRQKTCGCEIFHASRLFRGQTFVFFSFHSFPVCSEVVGVKLKGSWRWGIHSD